jgi:hypothetical protein
MKIVLDEYGCCMSEECKFCKDCAQHSSAGDFRTDDGFRPELSLTSCETADRPKHIDYEPIYREVPDNVDTLETGFMSLKEILGRIDDYQI